MTEDTYIGTCIAGDASIVLFRLVPDMSRQASSTPFECHQPLVLAHLGGVAVRMTVVVSKPNAGPGGLPFFSIMHGCWLACRVACVAQFEKLRHALQVQYMRVRGQGRSAARYRSRFRAS